MGNKLEPIGQIIESPDAKMREVDLASNEKLAILGHMTMRKQRLMQEAKGDETACNRVNAFNVEGVVASAYSIEFWIGLRSP